MNVSYLPKSRGQKYSDGFIKQHRMWEAIEYFIEKNVEYGRDRFHFDTKWFHKHGNISSYWLMVERNPDPNYWKKVIDFIFSDDYRSTYRGTLIKYILEAGRDFVPNERKFVKELNEETIMLECISRLRWKEGFRTGEPPDSRFDKYFREDGIPTWETWDKFKIGYHWRFQIKHQTGEMPVWEEEN